MDGGNPVSIPGSGWEQPGLPAARLVVAANDRRAAGWNPAAVPGRVRRTCRLMEQWREDPFSVWICTTRRGVLPGREHASDEREFLKAVGVRAPHDPVTIDHRAASVSGVRIFPMRVGIFSASIRGRRVSAGSAPSPSWGASGPECGGTLPPQTSGWHGKTPDSAR